MVGRVEVCSEDARRQQSTRGALADGSAGSLRQPAAGNLLSAVMTAGNAHGPTRRPPRGLWRS
eukprot:13314640-Alexandrium_andersonii.AAC.1